MFINVNDAEYWQKFYNTINTSQECSDFCKYIVKYFTNMDSYCNISSVLDCGCGNGRDSYYLSKLFKVDGVDNCGYIPTSKDNANFFQDDFVTMDKTSYNLIYSRFTFHSISNKQHDIFLDSIKDGSYLVIETRSKKGQDYEVFHGKTHYRNYTDISYLKDLLVKKSFEIYFIDENSSFAKYKNEDPICIRVICKKVKKCIV